MEQLFGEQWNEDDIGMNALRAGNPWDLGGPTVLHSPWWIRAHWGRVFDVVALRPLTDIDDAGGHGLVLLRRKSVHLTVRDLERLEPDEPREMSAKQHHVEQLRRETLELQRNSQDLKQQLDAAITRYEVQRQQCLDELRRCRESLAAMQETRSWRLTAPLRTAKAALRQRRPRA